MLTAEQVRALIVTRIIETNGSCNSYHIGHVTGQLRALVAVLNDGVPAKAYCDYDLRDVLRLAQIPFRDQPKGRFGFESDWLVAHGFVIQGDPADPEDPTARIYHPAFSKVSW